VRSLRAYSVHAGRRVGHRNPRHHHSDDDRLLSDAYAARTGVSDRRKTARRNAGISLPRIQAARAVRIDNNYYHFASAAVAVYSSHTTASSSLRVVDSVQCGSWSVAGHNRYYATANLLRFLGCPSVYSQGGSCAAPGYQHSSSLFILTLRTCEKY